MLNNNSHNNDTSIKSNENYIASDADRELDSSALQKFSSKSDMSKTMAKSEQVPRTPTAICLRPHFIGNDESSTISTIVTTTTFKQLFNSHTRWHRTRHKSALNNGFGSGVDIIGAPNHRSIRDAAAAYDNDGVSGIGRRMGNVIDAKNRHAIKRDVNNFSAHILDGISYFFRRNSSNGSRTIKTAGSTETSVYANDTTIMASNQMPTAEFNGILPTMTTIDPLTPANYPTTTAGSTAPQRRANHVNDNRTAINRTIGNRNNGTIMNISNITATGLTVSRSNVNNVFEMEARMHQFDDSGVDGIGGHAASGGRQLAANGYETNTWGNGRQWMPKQQWQTQQQQQQEQQVQRNGLITLLGLFEMSTRNGERPEGHTELLAARMAIRHINERALLPGYKLQLITNDTKVSFELFGSM